MGVLTALVVVFSQLFYFQTARYAKKEIKTEKQEKQQDHGDEANVSLPSFSQPSSAHVEANQEPCCLLEILFEKSKEEDRTNRLPFSFSKFFQTLFRVIIAPNAP